MAQLQMTDLMRISGRIQQAFGGNNDLLGCVEIVSPEGQPRISNDALRELLGIRKKSPPIHGHGLPQPALTYIEDAQMFGSFKSRRVIRSKPFFVAL